MGQTVSPVSLRRGSKIKLDNDVWVVTDFTHVTPGNKHGFVRLRIKSLTTGRVNVKTIRSREDVELADVTFRAMTFLYHEGDASVFMDSQTYEQVSIPLDLMETARGFLKDESEVQVTFYEGRAIGVELPPKVDLKVVETTDVVRGDTATNITKAAVLETGLQTQVPPFIGVGDVIRVSTDDGSYVERVATG